MTSIPNPQPSEASQKILAEIAREGIVPRPKWYWEARNRALWIPGILTTLFGAYTLSGILYWLSHGEWENYTYTRYSAARYALMSAPIAWVICFGLFSLLTIYMVKRTTTGYRLRRRNILLGSLFGSIVIGMLFYNAAERLQSQPLTGYHTPTTRNQLRLWQNPQEGRILGSITEVHENEGTLTLVDVEGSTWTIETRELLMMPPPGVWEQKNIRVVGIVPKGMYMTACYILPWNFSLEEPKKRLFEKMKAAQEELFELEKEAQTCRDLFAAE